MATMERMKDKSSSRTYIILCGAEMTQRHDGGFYVTTFRRDSEPPLGFKSSRQDAEDQPRQITR